MQETALGTARILDHRDGRVLRQTGLHEPRGDGGRNGAAHIDGNRRAGNRQSRPIGKNAACQIVPVVKTSDDATPRSVSGSSKSAAAAKADVIPGTTS